jgi:5'-phosphate synthase pdxT subunit
LKVGILSFQGSFLDHSKSIEKIGFTPVFIKQDSNIQDIDALILPGGESTAMKKINNYLNIFNDLDKLIKSGIPTLSTCAGTILLANQVIGGNTTIPNIDIQITRNAYGRQTESFEGSVSFYDNEDIYCFIRAPKISSILSENVKVIAEHDKEVVGVQQNNIVALTFHPELNNDNYYLDWLHKFIKEGKYVRAF